MFDRRAVIPPHALLAALQLEIDIADKEKLARAAAIVNTQAAGDSRVPVVWVSRLGVVCDRNGCGELYDAYILDPSEGRKNGSATCT